MLILESLKHCVRITHFSQNLILLTILNCSSLAWLRRTFATCEKFVGILCNHITNLRVKRTRFGPQHWIFSSINIRLDIYSDHFMWIITYRGAHSCSAATHNIAEYLQFNNHNWTEQKSCALIQFKAYLNIHHPAGTFACLCEIFPDESNLNKLF